MFGRLLFVLMQECQHSEIRTFAEIGRPHAKVELAFFCVELLPTCPTFVSFAFFFRVGRCRLWGAHRMHDLPNSALQCTVRNENAIAPILVCEAKSVGLDNSNPHFLDSVVQRLIVPLDLYFEMGVHFGGGALHE